jgi:hypothetical protein
MSRTGISFGMRLLQRISIVLNHTSRVVAGLVPATPSLRAQSKQNRGGRDKPGHDAVKMVVQCDREPL